MRILIVGDWHSDIHEAPVSRALTSLGHQVTQFAWHRYFEGSDQRRSLHRRFQNKFLVGPALAAINRDLIAAAARHQPDLIFIYRGTHIWASTLRVLKRAVPSAVLLGYNNDDPFSGHHPFWLWRIFLQAIPEYDALLAYRHHNLEDFTRAGAVRVHLLRSWYIPEQNHPVVLSPEDKARFDCDVAFVGHYEADDRLEYLDAVAGTGWAMRLFGPDYPDTTTLANLRRFWPVQPVRSADYNKAICGAKIALCFLSKLNRDTYTRRCFEIPAAGTLLLSEYSDDLAAMYEPDVEAAYFRNKEELLAKVDLYLRDDSLRRSVAAAGHRRVLGDGHDVVSRMAQLLSWLEPLRAEIVRGR